MKPTILQIADYSAPYAGNFMASLTALGEACRARDWRMVLALPAAAKQRDWCAGMLAAGREIRFLPMGAGVPRLTAALIRMACEEDALLMHTHFSSRSDVAAWLASRILRMRGKQIGVVWHNHSDFPERATLARRTKAFLKCRLMSRNVRVIVVADHLRQEALAAGYSADRVQTIRNGVDLVRATSAARSRRQVHEEWGMAEDVPAAILFGWEPRIKGVDLAMDAVARLNEQGVPLVLVLIGTALMRAFVAEKTRGTTPPWLRVMAVTDDVAGAYQAATMFLSASRNEGLPYSVCEAMANRLPTVLSDIPAVSWAHETPGAVFFPPGDATALSEAMRTVLNWSTEERQRNTAANRQLVERDFSVERWVGQVLHVYEQSLPLPAPALPTRGECL